MPDETRPDEMPDTPADAERTVSRDVQQISTPTPRWLAPAALGVAVVAVALSIWALMSSMSSSDSGANAELPGDPKTRICTAFDVTARAVQLQTNADLGPDPVAKVAVAGNARLALVGGGQYLLSQLDSETPSDLAEPVRIFANQLQTIGMAALTGAVNTDPEQASRMTEADITRKQIFDMCK